MERPYRVRRSCLAVPASSERFIQKARGLPADEVFLDLEDAVAPSAKAQARAHAVAALTGDWGGRLVAVRVNDAATQWAHRDVLDVVCGGRTEVIILPKVTSPDHVVWLDLPRPTTPEPGASSRPMPTPPRCRRAARSCSATR